MKNKRTTKITLTDEIITKDLLNTKYYIFSISAIFFGLVFSLFACLFPFEGASWNLSSIILRIVFFLIINAIFGYLLGYRHLRD